LKTYGQHKQLGPLRTSPTYENVRKGYIILYPLRTFSYRCGDLTTAGASRACQMAAQHIGGPRPTGLADGWASKAERPEMPSWRSKQAWQATGLLSRPNGRWRVARLGEHSTSASRGLLMVGPAGQARLRSPRRLGGVVY
jgi:hypothetical protein